MKTSETHDLHANAASGRGFRVHGDDWAPVWFSLTQHDWQSLALIPCGAAISAATVTQSLVATGRLYDQEALSYILTERVQPAGVKDIITELEERRAAGGRMIVAVGSPLTEHGAVPIARACDACVLLVPLRRAHTADARRILAAVGTSQFLGAITFGER